MNKILNNQNFEPTSLDEKVAKPELKELLTKRYTNPFICFHKWIYWRFGQATRLHRICNKCYKKQKNIDAVKPRRRTLFFNPWVRDDYKT